jgi:hypothetical protein
VRKLRERMLRDGTDRGRLVVRGDDDGNGQASAPTLAARAGALPREAAKFATRRAAPRAVARGSAPRRIAALADTKQSAIR